MIINTMKHDYMKNVTLTRPSIPLVVLNITIIYSNGYCKITEPFCLPIFTVTALLFYSTCCCTFSDSNKYCMFTVRFAVNQQ